LYATSDLSGYGSEWPSMKTFVLSSSLFVGSAENGDISGWPVTRDSFNISFGKGTALYKAGGYRMFFDTYPAVG